MEADQDEVARPVQGPKVCLDRAALTQARGSFERHEVCLGDAKGALPFAVAEGRHALGNPVGADRAGAQGGQDEGGDEVTACMPRPSISAISFLAAEAIPSRA